jgi:hypothetical protein
LGEPFVFTRGRLAKEALPTGVSHGILLFTSLMIQPKD